MAFFIVLSVCPTLLSQTNVAASVMELANWANKCSRRVIPYLLLRLVHAGNSIP